MGTRTRSTSVVFAHPFELNGIDGVLPPGDYRVVTDEELIECLSFPVYRRVATAIFVPGASHHASSVEVVVVDPRELRAAQVRDKAAHQTPELEPRPPAQRAIGVWAAPLTRAEAQGHDDKTIDLDQHRGMAAQEATDLRRLLAEVEANER
jgi:hypothetical protein